MFEKELINVLKSKLTFFAVFLKIVNCTNCTDDEHGREQNSADITKQMQLAVCCLISENNLHNTFRVGIETGNIKILLQLAHLFVNFNINYDVRIF